MKQYKYRFKIVNMAYINIYIALNAKHKSISMKYIIINQ